MLGNKPVHYLVWHNYYKCNKAVGNGVLGLATKNKKLVSCLLCRNILNQKPKGGKKS